MFKKFFYIFILLLILFLMQETCGHCIEQRSKFLFFDFVKSVFLYPIVGIILLFFYGIYSDAVKELFIDIKKHFSVYRQRSVLKSIIDIVIFVPFMLMAVVPLLGGIDYKTGYDTFGAVFAIIFGLLQLYNIFTSKPKSRISRIIKIYIVLSLSMAGIYELVYIYNPSYYSFSSGIISRSEIDRMDTLYANIKKDYKRISKVSRLIAWLNGKTESEASDIIKNRYNKKFVTDYGEGVEHYYTTGLTHENPYGYIAFTNRNETVFIDGFDFSPLYGEVTSLTRDEYSAEKYIAALRNIERKLELMVDGNVKLLSELGLGKHFNIIDFIYFSIVTVSTLGYGDIVPNHTIVRILVVLHVLLGLYIIMVVSDKQNPKPEAA